jgi:hypothetical protein
MLYAMNAALDRAAQGDEVQDHHPDPDSRRPYRGLSPLPGGSNGSFRTLTWSGSITQDAPTFAGSRSWKKQEAGLKGCGKTQWRAQ